MRLRLAALLALTLSACQCGGPPIKTGENTPPEATILAPADGAELTGPGPFVLEGAAMDAEDGALLRGTLVWSSDLDGVLGSGESLEAPLRVGVHRLSLDATDSGGLKGRAQISVTVLGEGELENRPPSVTITSPPQNTLVDQGVALTVTGEAADPEDGPLSATSLVWTSDRQGALGNGATVTFQSTELGTHTLVLTATDSEGSAGYATLTLEVVLPGANRPPVVVVTAPATGAQYVVNEPVTLAGTANDPEEGALAAAALSWTSSRDGALGAGSTVTTSTLSQGVHVLTLTATDSLGLAGSAAVTVSINAPNNQPPTVKITAPASGHSVFQGTSITFSATATDPEDGSLSGAALAWSSSLDGSIGTGVSFATSSLSVGVHQIQLTATDSGGNTDAASIQVTVLQPNAAPTVGITSPAAGSSFTAGTTISLRGTATDAEDGALTGSALTWQSDKDGTLGTGVAVDTASLSVGQHLISLSAIDSGGRSASASVTITVQAAPVMLAPVARLTGPTQAVVGAAVAFDGSSSSDPDGSILTWRFGFGDGSADQVGTAQTASHAFASAGTFTVSLTVTDDQGLSGTTSLQVTVGNDVRVPSVIEQRVGAVLGSMCQIEARGDTLLIAFREQTHPSLFLGVLKGSTWTTELVDGPGFTVGGLVSEHFSLAADPSGVPHLAYLINREAGDTLHYAAKPGGAWTRERVDATYPSRYGRTAIALDPARALRPSIAYSTFVSGIGARTVLAQSASAGTWTETRLNFASSTGSQSLQGELSIDAAGTHFIPYNGLLGSWNGTATDYFTLPEAPSTWISAAWQAPGELLLLSGAGLLDVSLGVPLSTSTAEVSLFESFATQQQALTTDASGLPRLLVNHGGELELVTADSSGYWKRESLGATDSAGVDLTVDAAGRTRACFFRSGKLILY